MEKTAITPTREENFPEWYQQVIKHSSMAETSPVRGCMVIKPWGFAIWENIQADMDRRFKETGHVNAYFPLLIPKSYLEKEAEHVDGFAKECAVVTHHRLKASDDGKLHPDGELEEPFVIRPTSETIIGEMYAKWVQSYRDLPLLINQWANVMRWEMRTRLFLRTSEFLWQEGHTAHATQEEAVEETLKMLDVYEDFATDFLALPVFKGEKTPDERFPGAVNTYCIEAMMQDRKAVQAGTSHYLGQNFSKAFDISFSDKNGDQQLAYTTSWGTSTRLIGAMVMTHADDNGLVLPPAVAPYHVVIMPILKKSGDSSEIMKYCESLKASLSQKMLFGKPMRIFIDNRDLRGGEKSWDHIKKGVPIRLEIGPRDMAKDQVFMGRRDKGPKEKSSIAREDFIETADQILVEIQDGLLAKATKFRDDNTKFIDDLAEFKAFFTSNKSSSHEIHGGFAASFWHESAIDHPVLKELKVTPRCIPMDDAYKGQGSCIFTGEKSNQRVLFAKAY